MAAYTNGWLHTDYVWTYFVGLAVGFTSIMSSPKGSCEDSALSERFREGMAMSHCSQGDRTTPREIDCANSGVSTANL